MPIWKQERRNEPLEVFTWRTLRHFAVSCWIDAGLPPKAVQTFAGHKSLQVSMDRYEHLFKSDSTKVPWMGSPQDLLRWHRPGCLSPDK
jgi:integrase